MADETREEKEKEKEEAPKAAPQRIGDRAQTILRLLIGVLVILLIIGVSTVVAYQVSARVNRAGGMEAGQPADDPEAQAGEVKYETLEVGQFTALPAEGNQSYNVRVTIKLAAVSTRGDLDKVWQAVAERKDVIQDEINTALYGINPATFRQNQVQGIANLKGQILQAVNKHMPREHQIDKVLFTEFIFQ